MRPLSILWAAALLLAGCSTESETFWGRQS